MCSRHASCVHSSDMEALCAAPGMRTARSRRRITTGCSGRRSAPPLNRNVSQTALSDTPRQMARIARGRDDRQLPR